MMKRNMIVLIVCGMFLVSFSAFAGPLTGTTQGLFSMEAATNCTPDIKANGSDVPIVISPTTPVSIKVSLNPGDQAGLNAEWWIVAQLKSTFGIFPQYQYYAYVHPTGWLPGINPCIVMPLTALSSTNVLSATLSPGEYEFFFLTDDNVDGIPEGTWVDSVKVSVQKVSVQSSGDTWTDPVTGMVFKWVPGGCYDMGCGPWADSCFSNDPVHKVCVDGFWIGKYEVTQGQWQQIMGNSPSYFRYGDNYPVDRVSWDDCMSFINTLNAQTGSIFRLPTEAEWEYAARSGGREEKYAGGDVLDSLGWYWYNSGSQTHEAGTKAPNGLGIYDMSGNVREWCSDWYGSGYYSISPVDNPQGPPSGASRVNRGGGWYDIAQYCRTAYRGYDYPALGYYLIGFRLVLSSGQ